MPTWTSTAKDDLSPVRHSQPTTNSRTQNPKQKKSAEIGHLSATSERWCLLREPAAAGQSDPPEEHNTGGEGVSSIFEGVNATNP